jgi:phenylalanyl-tRNA synthetase beta chain
LKASLKWIKEFVDFALSPAEIANLLTMAGLEVEGIVPNSRDEGDAILEISVTPNRPDCLSIMGIAREVSAILRLPFKNSFVFTQLESALTGKEAGAGPIVEIKDPHLCPRYSSRIIYDVEVKPSPDWISKRLESHGFRPANNIVDITNYVLLEMGHPLHAFDLDKLTGKRIVVKVAGSERISDSVDRFLTLDNENRALNRDMLLIWDSEKPVAIAGVMGGLNSETTPSTGNLLLESAYFNPLSIRRTSKALNLTTESSYRFERGADINRVALALDRATQLIIEIAGGKTTRITDIYPNPFDTHHISVKLKKINDILGIKIKPSQVQDMLTRLGIENKREVKTTRSRGEGITVIPPNFRQDIHRDVDVIEEIARLYGYNKIPSTMPKVRMQPFSENTRWNLIKRVKDSMRKSGYSEVINYSFLNPSVLDKLKLPLDDKRRNPIKIRNPLRKEEETLRTTLIPALLDNVRLNIYRGEKALRLFEISSVFLDSGRSLPDEMLKIAAVYLKDKKTLLWHDEHDEFYDLKGAMENLFLELKIKNYSFIQAHSLNKPFLHPGKSCAININGQTVGFLGAVHPDVAQSFDVAPEINIFELDVDRIFSFIPTKITFSSIPKYPYIERDIAIIVPQDIKIAEAERAIRNVPMVRDMVESVRLFDIYTGKSIPKGKKSLAFTVRYRAGDRTLTDSEVNELHSKIVKNLEDSLKAELRS